MKVYIKNLPFHVGDRDLLALFAGFGAPRNATVIVDHQRGGSRGFGFVEFDDPSQGQAAISALNGTEYGGRTLVVDEARSKGPNRLDRRDFRSGSGSEHRTHQRDGRKGRPRT